MLDCGVSYSKLNRYLKNIKLIFISHIHTDHLLPTTIKQINNKEVTLTPLAYNYPNIKFICGSEDIVLKLTKCGVLKKNIFLLESGKKYDLGMCKVKLEELHHDATNHCLKCELNQKKMIYIVDTSNVDNVKAKDYDLYFIESNYREDLLKKHIDECEDKNKLYYLNRVPQTHLSYEQANSFLIENMSKNSYYQYIHESNYNFKEVEISE